MSEENNRKTWKTWNNIKNRDKTSQLNMVQDHLVHNTKLVLQIWSFTDFVCQESSWQIWFWWVLRGVWASPSHVWVVSVGKLCKNGARVWRVWNFQSGSVFHTLLLCLVLHFLSALLEGQRKGILEESIRDHMSVKHLKTWNQRIWEMITERMSNGQRGPDVFFLQRWKRTKRTKISDWIFRRRSTILCGPAVCCRRWPQSRLVSMHRRTWQLRQVIRFNAVDSKQAKVATVRERWEESKIVMFLQQTKVTENQ